MQKLKSSVHVAVPTGFDKDESLNTDTTIRHIKHLNDHGIQSVLVCGSTGEQNSLTVIEKIALLDSLNQSTINKDMEIIFGVSSIRQKDAVKLATVANNIPAICGVLLGFPPYIRPTQEEAIIYAESILKELPDKAIIIYNHPIRTGFDLSEDSLVYLINHYPNIVGVKECNDLSKASSIKKKIDRELDFYIGGDLDIDKHLAYGFNRLSSIVGNLYPEQVLSYFSDITQGKNTDNYDSLIQEWQSLFASRTIPKIKEQIAKTEGIPMSTSRSPLGN
ncbi:dihydrodipicolinate synthase [Lactococcus piscium]|uniref:Dihydrodipicolinate synthase n=1 Tax=Pseudolactococcus piscium TaxID=1364 RepID=A0A2A5RVU0_9LACT|nr:dihydrodipicolinate synthase family protein [Lactococcus piscium]PCS05288.1 dihydrodipicolinate synthase [Lactococcus piscium]